MRQTSLDMVYELAKQDPRVVFIGSDLGHGTLKKFKQDFPDRFFMEGISEAHVVGMAAGMAMEGKIPYVNTISTFLTRRCFEQVALDLCLHNLNVRLIGNGGGLVYAPLGPTHLAIEDIAIFRALPNMSIVAPADATEMKRLMPKTLEHRGPLYIRLGKGGDPVVTDPGMEFHIGKAYEMRRGADALIISTGITLKMALEAATALKESGVDTGVIHAPTVKPLDNDAILSAIRRARCVVCVEEHIASGGLGSAVGELILDSDLSNIKRFRRIGIPDRFPEKYGTQDSLMEECGISRDRIVSAIKEGIR
jgi:transketolase